MIHPSFKHLGGKADRESEDIFNYFLGYEKGDTPDKRIRRLFRGDQYEQQKTSKYVDPGVDENRVYGAGGDNERYD